MPTIATFAAASARGFGTRTSRFIYEFVGVTSDATVGTTWDGQENFAYFAQAGITSSNTITNTGGVLFSGTAGYLNSVTIDNSSGEGRALGMGLINVMPPVAKTVSFSTSVGGGSFNTFRILGGTAQPSIFYSNAQAGAVWPYTYNIANCKVGDIVLVGLFLRSNPANTVSASATNMTSVSASTSQSRIQSFAAYVTTDGTFSTTINGNEYQQWTQSIVVLRQSIGTSTGGSLTFSANGTFTIPTYNTLTIDATSGTGGQGGYTSRETGGSCTQGTNGGVGALSSVVGGGINATTTTGPGGSAGQCNPGNCTSGSKGNASSSLTTYTTGLTVGATATVTIGGGGTGGISSKSAPCSNSQNNGAAGTSGLVTVTWT